MVSIHLFAPNMFRHLGRMATQLFSVDPIYFRKPSSSQFIHSSSSLRRQVSPDDLPRIDVEGSKVRYSVSGKGPTTLLLIPRAFVSVEIDYGGLIPSLNKHKEFTVVSCDPLGCGYSRPPEKDFSGDFFRTDARVIGKMMQKLGYGKYAVLGGKQGGNIGVFIAAEFPESVTKLVLWETQGFVDEEMINRVKMTSNMSNWSPEMIDPLIEIYGKDNFRRLLAGYVEGVINFEKNQFNSKFKVALGNVKCPALIIHGEDDPICRIKHAAYLSEHIKNATLKVYPHGKQRLQLQEPREFAEFVLPFIM